MTAIAMNIKYPELFAASFLVACQWDASLVAPMKGKPLWTIVSEGDLKAKPGMDAITSAFEKQGSTVAQGSWKAEDGTQILNLNALDLMAQNKTIKYAVFQGGNHMYTWKYAYSISVIQEWLFAQSKKNEVSLNEFRSAGQ